MRKLFPLSLLLCACFLSAQSPTSVPAVTADQITLASRQMEFFIRATREGQDDQARQAAAARNELLARLQFQQKANQFVALWEDFASRLNDKQSFDAKLAKKLSKAFHELETSDGWPIRGQTIPDDHGK